MANAIHIEGNIDGGKAPVRSEAIDNFLGSAQVFVLALQDVLEEALLNEIAGGEISGSQIRVLKLVAQSRAETVSDVAAFQGVSIAAASKSIDRLVRRDLLKRSAGEEDRRSSELNLTRNGRHLLDRFENARLSALERIFNKFSVADLQRAAELVDRLTSSIVSHSANPAGVCLQCYVFRRGKCLVRDASRADCFYQRRKRRKRRGPEPAT